MIDLLRRYRRDLHQIPELDFDLPETSAYIERALAQYSCIITRPAPSAICAWFDCGKKETIAFRADMDGLPLDEKSAVLYCSTHSGKMHGCGHDGHMAMVLALASVIEKQKKNLPRNVLLIFQPAEETQGGAQSILRSGVLEKYDVVRIFGCHLWPELPYGIIASRPGPVMAKSSEIVAEVFGLTAHIAKADRGRDALLSASEFLTAVYEMEKKEIPPSFHRLLKFGIFQSGTACNAVSPYAYLKGSLRALDQSVFDHMRQRMEEIAEQIEAKRGCTFRLHLSEGHPPLHNTPELFDLIAAHCPQEIQILDEPSMTSEDFSCYAAHCPIFFFFLGLGVDVPLHADTFDFDESVLLFGLKLYSRLLTLP